MRNAPHVFWSAICYGQARGQGMTFIQPIRAIEIYHWAFYIQPCIWEKHHIRYFGRFPVSQFNDSLGGVDLKCTQWVQFRSS